MSNWSRGARDGRRARCAGANRRIAAPAVSVVAVLGSFVLLAGPIVDAAPNGHTASSATEEESALIATRKGSEFVVPIAHPNDPLPDENSLGPVADDSDQLPKGAINDMEEDAAQFGAALSEVVSQSVTSRPAQRQAAGKQPGTTRKASGDQWSPAIVVRRPSDATVASDQVPFEPATFNGILVGESSESDLRSAWGEPAESISTPDGTVLSYATEPFEAVEVLVCADEAVAAIKISLAGALEPRQLVRDLGLETFVPATVTDELGRPLGMVFPDRGVLFMFSEIGQGLTTVAGAYDPLVTHVAIQPLDSPSFVLRAEQRLHGPYEQNIDDLKTALALDPGFAHAHWLLADIYLATGQADLAEAAAAAAVELDPRNPAYRLRHARALELLAEYDDAVYEVRAVLDTDDLPPIIAAQALHRMARLASLGDSQIASKAISFDTKAIEVADALATSSDEQERRAAKRLLIDAHLAIAEEVARQSFDEKLESVSQWIGRASGIAEDAIANDGGGVELRLLVAQRALAAVASFKPAVDPAPWVAEAEEAVRSLAKESDDAMWQQRLQWELGLVYLHALRVEHLRRETTAALRYGKQAVEKLAAGAASRQAVHASQQLVGQLYFQIGAVHAVHRQDHVEAADWYDKAVPLVMTPRPVSELYSPRREGEVLVSMGVTYWQVGRQSRALEITRAGTDLVELAVADGILARSTLAVPYGNLATMYQHMGETSSAAEYAELAKSVDSAQGVSTAQAGRATATSRRGQAISTAAQGHVPRSMRR